MSAPTVLMIKGDYDQAGGPETLLSMVMRTMDRSQFNPMLVVLRKTDGNGADVLSTESSVVIPWRGLIRARQASRALSSTASITGASIIHTHDMRSNLTAYLQGHSRTVPWIAHIHGWLGNTHKGKFKLYERVDQYVIRKANLVLVGSESAKREVESHGISNVQVVHNSVEVPDTIANAEEVARLKDSIGLPQDKFIIGVFGRVHPGKGQMILLRAFHQLRESGKGAHLLVVGDGPDLGNLRSLAAELGITEHVTLTGYHADALLLVQTMDVVAIPSLKESLPLTALEAMARQRCVVASRVGDLPLVIEDGRNGRTVDPANAVELARVLGELLQNPDRRHQMAAAARRTIIDKFSAQSMTRKLEDIYADVVRAWRQDA